MRLLFLQSQTLQKLFLSAFCSSLMLVASSCYAITIDTFAIQQQVSSQGGSNALDQNAIISQSAIGGTRTIQAISTSGSAGVSLTATTPNLGALRYSHSQDDDVVGQSQIIWDGNTDLASIDVIGLGGIDLTEDGSTGFILKDVFFDFALSQSISLSLTVYDASDPTGNTFSKFDIILDAPVVFSDLTISYATPTSQGPSGAANMNNVGAITFLVDGSNIGVDFSFDNLITNGPCTLTPPVGGRVLDDCGECIAPTDPLYNQSCSDCLGVPNGTTLPGSSCDTQELGPCKPGIYTNNCVCTRVQDPTVEICDGADNNCNGEIDETFPQLGTTCGVVEDNCDVSGLFICDNGGGIKCDIDLTQANTGDCGNEIGCDGVPGSGAVPDKCGVCGGDGTTCENLGCEDNDISALLFELDGGAKKQEGLIKSLTKLIKRHSRKKATKAFIADVRDEAHDLQIANWILSWTLPVISVKCTSTIASQFCVENSNTDKLDTYKNRSKELQDLGFRVVKKLRKVTRNKTLVKRWRRRLIRQHKTNLGVAEKVPTTQSVCTGMA